MASDSVSEDVVAKSSSTHSTESNKAESENVVLNTDSSQELVQESFDQPEVQEQSEPQDQEDQQQMNPQQAKISGYLEKKGKLRMVSSWKKYWFVLEGRLLLYYRSRAEYDSISPCKGSITLGSPCNIKPGPASHCVFQIETRNNTITLRADSRAEQDKWMLAILGALNQTASSTNQTKLSHFRYSADDLAMRTPTDKPAKPALTRQNTLPERMKEVADIPMKKNQTEKQKEPPTGKSMVERLQSIGAQSYTANIASQENLIKVSKGSPKLPKNENLKKLLDKQISVESANEIGTDLKEEWIKEEENELYAQLDQKREEGIENEDDDEVIVDNQHYMSANEVLGGANLQEDAKETPTNPEKHIYQEINTIGANEHDVNAIMTETENSEYCQLVMPVDHNKNKIEYCEPLYATGGIYSTIPTEPALPPRPKHDEGAYSTCEHDKEKEQLDGSKKVAKDGEKANRLKKLAKMVKDERKESGGKRQSFVIRMFKRIKKDDSKGKDKEKEKGKMLQDTDNANVNNIKPNEEQPLQQEDEIVTPDPKVIDHNNKPEGIDQLVVELKEVLDEKHGKQGVSQDKSEDVIRENETSEEKLENTTAHENKPVGNVEMLVASDWIKEDTSLNIVDKANKKKNLDGQIEIDQEKGKANENANENANQTQSETETTSSQLEQLPQRQQPQLPLKQKHHEQQELSPKEFPGITKNLSDFDYDIYDTSQRLNIPRPKLLPKSKRQRHFTNNNIPSSKTHLQHVRLYQHHQQQQQQQQQQHEMPEQLLHHKDEKHLMTIDEILDDLENHNYEPFSRQKVKELIEKFNDDTEHDSVDNDDAEEEINVELREKHVNCERNSEELNSLLDELSKVTSAPIINPPGVTSSLAINGPFSDEDWQNIVPIRKRRHSDPDYDIPRPHSALQILPSEEKEESKMRPTRFFGPVIIGQINGDSTSCGTSITPDSLEVDTVSYPAKNYTSSIEEDRSMRSYTSHIYSSNESHQNNNNYSHESHINQSQHPNPNNENIITSTDSTNINIESNTSKIKEDMYAKPKSLLSLIVPNTEYEHAFYVNNNNNNNNKSNNNMNMKTADETDNHYQTEGENEQEINNSICLDSLEPFVENDS